MKKIIIAIDGPAGSGKSVVAKELAKKLNYLYIDTGSMFRAITYACFQNNIDPKDEHAVNELLKIIDIDFNKHGKVMLNKKTIPDRFLRTPQINQNVSTYISVYKSVRDYLIVKQRAIAKDKAIVLDGRDIGTVVLPNAELKIYQTASIEKRAQRRKGQYQRLGKVIDFEKIKQEVKDRDYADMNRSIAPLVKASDAIEIDTSNMSINQVVDVIYQLAIERGGE